MDDSFDVVVVGGRCAGAPLATMLARAGLRVCVVDRDRFPSDTLSTHGIQPAGIRVLERIGVLDSLLALAPPLERLRMFFDDDVVIASDVVAITAAHGLSVRRVVLDAILLDAAAAAGAEVRTGTRVMGLLTDDGRVTGVRTTAGDVSARLVVGADGTRSEVARGVAAEKYHPTANGRVFVWGYHEADPTDGEMWIGKLGDHAYLVMPTDDGLSLLAVCPSIERRDEVRADREGVYRAGIRAWPELDGRLEGAERRGGLLTMANMHGYFRRSAGPGWVLLGDAGHFKDPAAGQGIADALRQAERLAGAIERAWEGGPDRLDAALREWWRWRDDDAWEMYWFAHDMGAAGPTPSILREGQRRVAADPTLSAGLVRILNHDARPSEVFRPALRAATMAGALRRNPGRRRTVVREAGTVLAEEVRRRRAARSLARAS